MTSSFLTSMKAMLIESIAQKWCSIRPRLVYSASNSPSGLLITAFPNRHTISEKICRYSMSNLNVWGAHSLPLCIDSLPLHYRDLPFSHTASTPYRRLQIFSEIRLSVSAIETYPSDECLCLSYRDPANSMELCRDIGRCWTIRATFRLQIIDDVRTKEAIQTD